MASARQHVTVEGEFPMHRGGTLLTPTIAFETWGRLDARRSNAVLIFTGLSPSAHAASSPIDPSPGWWEEIVGPGRPIDTRRWFVICVNSLGSCFGSTGPASADPRTGEIYRLTFPVLSADNAYKGPYAGVRRGLGEVVEAELRVDRHIVASIGVPSPTVAETCRTRTVTGSCGLRIMRIRAHMPICGG